MPSNQVTLLRNRGGAFTSRARSPQVWRDIPFESVKNGEVDGVVFDLEFVNGFKLATNVNASVAYWDQGVNLFGSDGAAVADGAVFGGGVTFSSDGDNEGVSFQQSVLPFKISRSNGAFAMEARLKTSTITDTKHGFFIGLLDAATLSATVPIAAAGTLADENFVGFHRLEGDGDQIDVVYKADGVTQVTVQADALAVAPYSSALVADTFVKLGMRFDPKYDQGPQALGHNYLKFYIDNVYVASKQIHSTAGDDFPNDVLMGVCFALLNATASTPGNTTIDWIKACQLGI